MIEIIELITEIFTTRIDFIISVLMIAIGFILLLSSAKIYAIIIAILLVIAGIVILVRAFKKS